MKKDLANIKQLEEIFKDDQDLLLFYVTWLKNGMNAKAAYKELHPTVGDFSAATLGSRMLKKVDKSLLFEAYGLDIAKYLEQLRDGLDAKKVNEFDGTLYEDHTTRKPYHDKLGKLLGLEKDKAVIEINQQNNYIGWDQFIAEVKRRKEDKV